MGSGGEGPPRPCPRIAADRPPGAFQRRVGLALIVPSAAGIWLESWVLLAYRQVFLPPLIPVATLAVIFMVLTSMRFVKADREVRERTRKLALMQDAIIQSLAALTETRHHETGGTSSGPGTTSGSWPPGCGNTPGSETSWMTMSWTSSSGSPSPRYRQGRCARPDPPQARAVDAGGVRGDEAPHVVRFRDDPAGEAFDGGRRLLPVRRRSRPQSS